MKPFPFLVCLAVLLLLVQTGAASTETTNATNTTTATATTATLPAGTSAATTTTPDRLGGSVYFETYPAGATITLDNVVIGTSSFTYYSEKTGTMEVHIWRKGYENYTGQVTIEEGKRVVFSVDLKNLAHNILEETIPAEPVTTVTTIRKSTLVMPTPWPSGTESPVDPGVILGAVTGAIAILVVRRR